MDDIVRVSITPEQAGAALHISIIRDSLSTAELSEKVARGHVSTAALT